MSYKQCTKVLMKLNRPYPRTCKECGLGPCKYKDSEVRKAVKLAVA